MAFLFGLNMNSFKTKPAKLPAKTFANHSTKCMACGFFSSVKVSSLRPFMAEVKCGDRSMRTSRSKPHDLGVQWWMLIRVSLPKRSVKVTNECEQNTKKKKRLIMYSLLNKIVCCVDEIQIFFFIIIMKNDEKKRYYINK